MTPEVRKKLIKLIRQFKLPSYKLESHRLHWLVENHRLHFHLRSHGEAEGGLMLIDKNGPGRAAVNRIVPVLPRRTTAVHPDTENVTDPTGEFSPPAGDGAAAPSGSAGGARTDSSQEGAPADAGGAPAAAGDTSAPGAFPDAGAAAAADALVDATADSDAASAVARAAAAAVFAGMSSS